jgi:hypothetical protein
LIEIFGIVDFALKEAVENERQDVEGNFTLCVGIIVERLASTKNISHLDYVASGWVS